MLCRPIALLLFTALGVACNPGSDAGSSCGSELPPVVAPLSIDAERRFSTIQYDTLWTLGGLHDTVLALPLGLHPVEDNLLVYDFNTLKLHRIGPDGALQWSWGKRGEGPGEIRNVRDIGVRQDGSIILVDGSNQRLTTLDPGGRMLHEQPLPKGLRVHSMAVVGDEQLALHGRSPLLSYWDQDSDLASVLLPDDFRCLSFVQGQGGAVGWRANLWVFGFTFGNGWMVLDGHEISGLYPYVEHTDFPVVRTMRQGMSTRTQMVERPPDSGRSFSVQGDTLFVLFGGQYAPGYLLDLK